MDFYLPTDGSVLIVDDKPEEALPLIQLLSSKGIASTYYSGTDDEELPSSPIQKVRIAFFDIQLFGGSDPHNFAQTIIRLLEKLIPSDNGPFVLILWSDRIEDNADVVESQVTAPACNRKPLCVLRLEKAAFFGTDTDDSSLIDLLEQVSDDLQHAFDPDSMTIIKDAISENYFLPDKKVPLDDAMKNITNELNQKLQENVDSFQIFTIWESLVSQSAGETVKVYSMLHKDEHHWAENIKHIIYRMAHAQLGKKVDEVDKNTLIIHALRTLNHTFLDQVEANINKLNNLPGIVNISRDDISYITNIDSHSYKLSWRANTGRYQFYVDETLVPLSSPGYHKIDQLRNKVKIQFDRHQPPISIQPFDEVVASYLSIKPEINTKLHIDPSPPTHVQPGNLYEFKIHLIKRRLQVLSNYFKKADLIDDVGNCKLDIKILRQIKFVELEVSPTCDFAQDKWLKSRTLPGLLFPSSLNLKMNGSSSFYTAVPEIKFNDIDYKLVFDCKLFKSSDMSVIEAMGSPIFRLRHELHADIIAHLSSHIIRLGVSFIE